MTVSELTIKLAGEAGQGVESSGAGFSKALFRLGFHVVTTSDYMSRIRGGHNSFGIRVAHHPVKGPSDRVHLLLAFDAESIDQHLSEMEPGGVVILDASLGRLAQRVQQAGVQPVVVPLEKMAEEVGGSKVMANTAALGLAMGLMQLPLHTVEQVIQENFGRRKSGGVAEANLRVARAGHELARREFAGRFPWRIRPPETANGQGRLLIAGNQALALGALAARCRFIAAYPMTPASSLYEWLTAHAARYGIVSKQAEDEIAAVAMAIGAAHAGARAMTVTSGGGFSLMVEALGLAGMTETPLVVVLAQRPGPSTGMPTRTSQGDLLFALHASQGDFPRILLAPGTVEECFEAGVRAFNLAEKYQCPVIVLTDGYLASALQSAPEAAFDLVNVPLERGALLTRSEADRLEKPYRRYQVTPDGISPRALPGHPKTVFLVISDEHTEEGHFESEDAANRLVQQSKRMRKLEAARAEMRGPSRYGPAQADVTLVGWGSTRGALEEAVGELSRQGMSANAFHFTDIWPFPQAGVEAILGLRYMVVVEGNYTGQFARLIRAETGRKADEIITRDDGRPISAGYVLSHLERVASVAGRQAV